MLERLFKLREHNTNVRTEIVAGLTTFMTMAYILFVNPLLLGFAKMPTEGVYIATALGAALVTLAMGLFVNFPIALAPGMGLNAYFLSVVASGKMSWEVGLGAVFISGIIFIILTVTRVRQLLVVAVPDSLKAAITVGIGLFITIIGFKTGGLLSILWHPAPTSMAEAGKAIQHSGSALLNMDDWDLVLGNFVHTPAVLVTLLGLAITGILMALRVRAAILLGIIITTIVGMFVGPVTDLGSLRHAEWIPSFQHSLIGHLDIAGALGKGLLDVIAVFTFVELFDTFGTMVGTANKAGLLDRPDGHRRLGRAMLVDAAGVSVGALLGTSTITAYVESSSGVAAGGRTGLTSVTVGILFLLALFFLGPIAMMIPSSATAPALIIVGVLMMGAVKNIDFEDFGIALPAFLTIVLMPFTWSIANGISAGIIFFVLINGVRKLFGKDSIKIHWLMWVLGILAILRYIFISS